MSGEARRVRRAAAARGTEGPHWRDTSAGCARARVLFRARSPSVAASWHRRDGQKQKRNASQTEAICMTCLQST